MKVKRQQRSLEASQISIDILTEKVEAFFKRHPELNSKSRFYPENPSSFAADKSGSERDVILFGNTFKSLMTSGVWPLSKIRLWCLSHRFKDYVEELFPDISIEVIPREELFPKRKIPHRVHDLGSPFDLVYAGRISAQKNIEALIYTCFYLQESGVPCTLHLMGDFDDHYHEHLGRRVTANYQKRIELLISSLSWQVVPVIHAKKAATEWINYPFINPVAISLSSYFCEDFGVSLAQANQERWPIICTDFGGHADIESEQIIKVPYTICSHLPEVVISEMAARLAQFLNQQAFKKTTIDNSCKTSLSTQSPSYLTIELLDKARRSLSLRLGKEAEAVALESLSTFADSVSGSWVIQRIVNYLGAPDPSYSVVLFDCDERETSLKDRQRIKKAISEIPQMAKIHFVSSKNIFYKDQINILLESKKVFLILDEQLQEKVAATLLQQVGLAKARIKYS